jgi:hypothetical protein
MFQSEEAGLSQPQMMSTALFRVLEIEQLLRLLAEPSVLAI